MCSFTTTRVSILTLCEASPSERFSGPQAPDPNDPCRGPWRPTLTEGRDLTGRQEPAPCPRLLELRTGSSGPNSMHCPIRAATVSYLQMVRMGAAKTHRRQRARAGSRPGQTARVCYGDWPGVSSGTCRSHTASSARGHSTPRPHRRPRQIEPRGNMCHRQRVHSIAGGAAFITLEADAVARTARIAWAAHLARQATDTLSRAQLLRQTADATS